MPEAHVEIEKASEESKAVPTQSVVVRRHVEAVRRWQRIFSRFFIEPFVRSRNPPWFDALGAAMGFLVGFGVPVGGQVITLGLLRASFRFNSLIAFACTWVTNPFSFVPMYYFYYYCGSLMLGEPEVMSMKAFRELMAPMLSPGHFWQTFQAFLSLGWDIMIRWFATAVIISPASAIIGYFLTYRLQKMRCKRRAEKMGISYEKLLEDFEKRVRHGAAWDS